MQVIKNGAVERDEWRHLADDETMPAARFTVSGQRWVAERSELLSRGADVGVRLTGDSDLHEIQADLDRIALIVIEFPSMADGRGFSLARLLRTRFGYTGEIRASGAFIRDQIYFLQRVGVNAFEVPEDQTPENWLPAFAEFSINYQCSTDERQPLYRRIRRES